MFKILQIILILFSLISNNIKCFAKIDENLQKFDSQVNYDHQIPAIQKYNNCPNNIKCVPKIQCPAHVEMAENEKPQLCDLPAGKPGYCCFTGQHHSVSTRSKRSITEPVFIQDSIVEEARTKYADLLEQSESLPTNIANPSSDQHQHHHNLFHSSTVGDVNAVNNSKTAIEQVLASQIYRERKHIPARDFQFGKVKADFSKSQFTTKCPRPIQCLNFHNIYRTIDGSCNNPFHPIWGVTGQPMERLLPPAYEDGIWIPRQHSVDGSLLTGAREISRILLPDIDRPHPLYNLLLMQFGQFIAHDVTHSESISRPDGTPIECCSADGSQILPPELSHFACMAIPIERNDDFYRKFNQGCLNFVRSALVPNQACRASFGKQLTTVTHYLDGSPIYGSTEKVAAELRTFRGGQLRMSKNQGRNLLPQTRSFTQCERVERGSPCFLAGDDRANQIISLVVLHMIFAREHNRIATVMSAINPHYNDEKLYQETRRIVIAQLQHIIYNEYLPLVIGSHTMKRFGLYTLSRGYNSNYNSEQNPAITNAFTTAAYRFGHSVVDGQFKLRQNSVNQENIEIPDVMFNPSRLLQRNFYDEMIITLTHQPMQQFDNSVTHGLSRFLFRGRKPFGADLAAINIQRGRDHGIRTYNDYLELSGHHRIKSFHEFHPEIANRLSLVYKHPDDIDLWIGGLTEPSIGDALVGPTFSEIIADQFARLRFGDRYFYDNGPKINPGHFTMHQLDEIKKIRMSTIICNNLDYFVTNEITPLAFLRADLSKNIPVRCDSTAVPRINLNAWRETTRSK